MTRELIGFMMVSLVLIIAVLVGISYRRKRIAETANFSPLPAPKNCEGLDVLYVSTVFADNPLRKLLAHGLGPRGKASVSVNEDGISICRKGEQGFLIAKQVVQGVEKSTATIDRAVEPGGLSSIYWRHDGADLITNLRFSGKSDRESFEKEVGI
mgnify:CR=1 FL=1